MDIVVNIMPKRSLTERFLIFGLMLIFALMPLKSFALSEEELQLALLIKLSQFVTWTNRNDQKFDFCLYKGKGYEHLVSQKNSSLNVGKSPVRFVFLNDNSTVAEIHQCHLLFITEGSAVATKRILQRAIFASTLTVRTLDEFSHIGGMIELVKSQGRYTFKVNLSPVRDSKLQISSSFLEIATVIEGGSR